MKIPWTKESIAILKSLREDGQDWLTIAAACGHTDDSCRTKAGELGIFKIGKNHNERHKGVTNDGPAWNHRSTGRPMAKVPEMRPCIVCRDLFKSWDRTKNQICSKHER